MASSFSTLGIELIATGEASGLWGDKTNVNLQMFQEITSGYVAQSIAGGAQTTALSITNATTGDTARQMIIEFTGTISGNQIVTIPDSLEKMYIIKNSTSGAHTVQFKTVSGSGVTFGASDKGTKLVFANGTNVVDAGLGGGIDLNGEELILDEDADTSITADTDDQIDIKIAGADDFRFTANTFTALSGSSVVIPDSGLTLGSTAVTSTAAELNILDGVTSTAAELNILDGVTSTAAELNILDGATVVVGEINALDLGSTAVGTAIASKAVILDSNKDYTGIRNFTISGEIDAATGDFSGAVDVAGATTTAAITASGIIKTDATTNATSTTDGSLQTDGGLSVVLDAIFGDDVSLLSDASVLKFGADAEVTLTHVHNDGLLLNSDNQLQFRDSAINIRSDADGDLDINADDEVEINSTLIDINGNVEISGTLAQAGIATFAVAANVTQGALTSSSNAVAWDASAKPNAFHLTTENTTFSAPSNAVEGAFIVLEINYNGSHTIAFNTIFEFAASTAPTFTSTDAKTDILVFRYNGSVWQEVGRTLNLSES